MKILHIIVDLDVGGAELILKRLAQDHTQRFSAEHVIVSLTDMGKVGMEMAEAGFQVIALGMKGLPDSFSVLVRLTRLISSHRPDIVQTWMYHSDLIGGLAARLSGVSRVIWGIRSTDIRQGGSRATLLIRALCARLSYRIPVAIVCAANVSRDIHVGLGYAVEKMGVIPNGFDLRRLVASNEQRVAIRTACDIRANERVIGSIGRYSPVKDHAVFIAAAGRLLANHGDLKLLLVGRGLDYHNQELMALINATPRPNAFVLLGERSDVANCLKAMDIFCLHSRTEGFPNVLGEAMAMGLPCVTSDVGDAAYLLGDHGLVVPSQDEQALTFALDHMLGAEKAELTAMGAAAKERIESYFSMEMMTERFHKLYANLLPSIE